jgi:hypothetical protein
MSLELWIEKPWKIVTAQLVHGCSAAAHVPFTVHKRKEANTFSAIAKTNVSRQVSRCCPARQQGLM